jgi:hypothetical protein
MAMKVMIGVIASAVLCHCEHSEAISSLMLLTVKGLLRRASLPVRSGGLATTLILYFVIPSVTCILQTMTIY